MIVVEVRRGGAPVYRRRINPCSPGAVSLLAWRASQLRSDDGRQRAGPAIHLGLAVTCPACGAEPGRFCERWCRGVA